MKIKVISRNMARAEEVAEIVRGSGAGLEVLPAAGSPQNLLTAVNGSRPGLVVLDAVDAEALDAIERLTHEHPEVELILISAEQSPAFLLKAMQAGVREVLPPPVSAQALQSAVQRFTRKHAPVAHVEQGEVLAFMGCKGGSGATFLAANLAHALSSRCARTVALLDLDLQFGDALLMLSDQRAVSDVAEVARSIGRLDAALLRSSMVTVSDTLSVLPAPAELSQALEVKAAHIGAIIKQARQMFDFVVLDVGRSIDALSLQALDQATRIFPVLQLSVPQARDAKRLRTLFRSLEYPASRINWMVNRYQKGGDITLESLQQALGSTGLRTIPNHFNGVSASVNQGVPIDRLARSNPVARALHDLALSIAPVEAGKNSGWLSSVFGGT